MRMGMLTLLLMASACKGDKDIDTAVPLDCDGEGTVPMGSVAVPEWPPGFDDALADYQALAGRWTAQACGQQIGVAITIRPNEDIDFIEDPLPSGHQCGCTHDPSQPRDGELLAIARTSLSLAVTDYPHAGFSEENAGNVPNVPVTFFDGIPNMRVRGCYNHLVPPVLGLEFDDNLITIRMGDSGLSGSVQLVGDNVESESCELTDFTYIGAI